MFGKLDKRDAKGIAEAIEGIMEEAFLNMRDMGLKYKNVDEMADGIEMDTRLAFEDWIDSEEYEFEVSDCDAFMDRNARWCLELSSMVKENEILRAAYDMDALDPHNFVHEVYAFFTHKLVEYLVEVSSPVAKICEAEEIKIGFLEEYVLSAEAKKYITADAIEKILDKFEVETFELRQSR